MIQEEMKKQGLRIRMAREKKGMTQEALADKVHVTKQAVSNWENGNNNVDGATVPVLEKELGIRLFARTESVEGEFGVKKRLRPLEQISSLADLNTEMEGLVNMVDVDSAFASTVSRMLKRLLSEVLGFEIYFLDHIQKEYKKFPLTWEMIASDLRDIIDCREEYPIPNRGETPPFFRQGFLAKKIQYMAFMIGFGLFEDFDEIDYRNGYEQQVGRQGESDGYELLDLVSDQDNSIMISFRAAVLEMAIIIQSIV